MKALIKILSLISCVLLTSCFTVIETTTDNNEYYIDYSEPITIIAPPEIYINYPDTEPREEMQEEYKERTNTRPSNGITTRDTGAQRSSKINGNENRGNNRDSKNVQQSSKSQRR